MRLICPNCGAQYEVDANMIPPEGRDVQCSNCAQTWFQEPEGATPRPPQPAEPEPEAQAAPEVEAGEEVASAGPTPTVEVEEFTVEEPQADDAPVAETEETEEEVSAAGDGDADDPDDTDADEDDDTGTPAELGLPRKPSEQLDEEVLGILREEAEREAEARRREQSTGLETQPDLGLDDGPDASDAPVQTAVAAHMQRMREAEAEADETPQPASARSDLLPDIEEINSSLRPAAEHAEVQEVEDPAVVAGRERKGFRLGFTLIIVLVALLIMAYVFAPQLAVQVPQAQGVLTAYVDVANSVRDMIGGLLGGSMDAPSTE